MNSGLAKQVQEISWYHQIELPGGITTPGVNRSGFATERLELPTSLAGKSVLDVGAWDGYLSFEAANRGARRVLATDSFVWEQPQYGQRGFLLAREALGLTEKVEDRFIDVMDISPETLGETFDVVLFSGVLYHLHNPIEALRRVASVCDGLLFLETETALNFLPYPAARVWPSTGLRGDPTNWFSFNARALVDLLHSLGFEHVDVKYRTPTWRRVARAAKTPSAFLEGLRGSRIVIHAER